MNEIEAEIENNSDGDTLRADSWRPGRREVQAAGFLEPAEDLSLRSFRNVAEIHAIQYALGQTGWNRRRAAKLLNISYRSLLYKIRQHKITPAIEFHG